MQRRVGRAQVVDVVGGDGGQAQLAGQEVELLHVAGGARQLFVDELDEEVVAAEEPRVALRGQPGARFVAGAKKGAHLAASAGRQGDEVVVVGGQCGDAGQRRLAAMLEVGGADDAAELRPALVVAGQQGEVIAGCGELAARRGRGEVRGGDARDDGLGWGRGRAGCGGLGGRARASRPRVRHPRLAPRVALTLRVRPHPRALLRRLARCRSGARRSTHGGERAGGGCVAAHPSPEGDGLGPGRFGYVGRRRGEDGFDADLDADDGFDAGRPAGLVEAHGAVEAVVVGDRQGRHAQAAGGVDEFVDASGAVAEREVGVNVKVDEAHATPGGPCRWGECSAQTARASARHVGRRVPGQGRSPAVLDSPPNDPSMKRTHVRVKGG